MWIRLRRGLGDGDVDFQHVDGCDGCQEPLGDVWTALTGFRKPTVFVCEACRPLIAALDRQVDRGELTVEEAAAAFERARWSNGRRTS